MNNTHRWVQRENGNSPRTNYLVDNLPERDHKRYTYSPHPKYLTHNGVFKPNQKINRNFSQSRPIPHHDHHMQTRYNYNSYNHPIQTTRYHQYNDSTQNIPHPRTQFTKIQNPLLKQGRLKPGYPVTPTKCEILKIIKLSSKVLSNQQIKILAKRLKFTPNTSKSDPKRNAH